MGNMSAQEPTLEKILADSPAGEHYKGLGIEPLQYITANAIPYEEACVIKYVTRWRRKNGLEDLKKARFYIDYLISCEENKSVHSA